MLPSSNRLLFGIHKGLQTLSQAGVPADSQPALNAINLALQELFLQEDHVFFEERVRQGQALLKEGQRLAERLKAPAKYFQLSDRAATDPIAAQDILSADLMNLMRALTPEEDDHEDVKLYLARVMDWENELYKARHRPPPADAPVATQKIGGDLSEASIKHYFEQRFPKRAPIAIRSLKTLSGGFSKATVLLDIEYSDGAQESVVIRAEQPNSLLLLDGAQIDNEYHVLKYAHAAGHAVADPLWLETDPSHLGKRFLVSRKAKGSNFGSRVDVDQQLSETLLGDFMEKLVRVHRTPIDPANEDVAKSHLGKWAAYKTLRELIPAQVQQWREGIVRFQLPPSPLLERVLGWLEQNAPDSDEPPSLLHGDYGLHNIMIEGDHISCLLDWEASGLGDPADELAWLLDGLRVQIDPARLLALYEEIAQRRIPEERLRYFEVFNCLRFAVTCPRGLVLFENNRSLDVGVCDLGLRFMYFGTGRLNESIARAEALRRTR